MAADMAVKTGVRAGVSSVVTGEKFKNSLITAAVSGVESLKTIGERDRWLRDTHGNAGKVPGQVAGKMRGQEF